MATIVEGPKIAALSCGKPAYLVVLLHGHECGSQALVDLALNWAPTMPKADFIAAELSCSGGDAGSPQQWFNIEDASPAKSAGAIGTIAPLLDNFLDEMLAQRRLPDSHLALVGFSQGAMLALRLGLQRPRQMAAVVSFSGALVLDSLSFETASKPPVLLIHGEADPIVPFAEMTRAKEKLKARGVPVMALRRPGLGHAIDDDGVIAAGDFLTKFVRHKPAEKHDHDEDHAH
jgi:phospholipase/carboxylesterase